MFAANLNLDVISMADLENALQVWNDACLVDPRTQIGGICMIVDFTSLHKDDILRMFDPKLTKASTKYFQVYIPLHSHIVAADSLTVHSKMVFQLLNLL